MKYMVERIYSLQCLDGASAPQYSELGAPLLCTYLLSPHMLCLPGQLRNDLACVQSPAQHSACKIFPHSMKCQ